MNKTRYRKTFHSLEEASKYVEQIKNTHKQKNYAHRLFGSTKELKAKIEEANPNIVLLGEYSDITKALRVKVKCLKHNYEYDAAVSQLIHGAGVGCCRLCLNENMRQERGLSHEEYVNRVAKVQPNIKVLGKYVSMSRRIKCECMIDGYIWEPRAQEPLVNRGCPICKNSKKTVAAGFNDVLTSNPEIVPFLVNPNEAKAYKAGSKHIVDFKCPLCGYIKQYPISNVVNFGFACDICGDGVSYPNKISRYMLLQLPVENLVFEFNTDWSKPYRYDNYFEFKGKKYILEMDGVFHFKQSAFKTNALPLKELKKRDVEKEKRAREHGITVIRVECIRSEKDYIISHIKQSILADIFDLSIIDWEKVEESARSSLIKKACELYEQQAGQSPEEIANQLMIDRHTAKKYLKIGATIGWCSYDEEKSRELGKDKVAKVIRARHGKKISVFDSNHNFIASYDSVSQTARELEKLTGESLKIGSISNRCVDHKAYKNFYFEFSNQEENIQKPFSIDNRKKVSVFDSDHKYIETFYSATSAARELTRRTGVLFRPQSISGKCGSNTAYKDYYFEFADPTHVVENEKIVYNADNTKAVLMVSMTGDVLKKYDSVRDASVENGIPKESITYCAMRNAKKYPKPISLSSYGYVWIYAEVVPENTKHIDYRDNLRKKVQQIDDNGTVINIYDSVKEAESTTNIHNIHGVLSKKDKNYNHKAGGYYWRYV